MMKNFYGVLMAAFLFVNAAHGGYNHKILDSEADTFTSRLCSDTPIKLERVKESLDVLKPREDMGSKYSSPHFRDDLITQLNNDKFSRFANLCRDASAEGDKPTQIAANLLLEKVSEKYGSHLKRIERARTRSAASTHSADLFEGYTYSISSKELLRIFSTADKHMGLLGK